MNVDQISKDLKGVKPSKNFSVFLVCLLLAFLFWMLNAFTKNYSTIIEVPIEYVNIPSDKIISKTLPQKASAEVSGTGFRLLSVSYFNAPEPIQIDFNLGAKKVGFKKLVSSFGPEVIRSQVMDDIPSELSLGSLSIDSLRVVVEEKSSKNLRIGANLLLNIEYPFFLGSKIKISPENISVRGANSIITGLDSISTELIELGSLKEETTVTVALKFPKGTESDTKEVEITIPIDEYTEGKIEIPIEVEKLPKSINPKKQELLLFPSTVSVTYLVGLKNYDKVKKEDFKFTADGSSIEQKKLTLLVSKKVVPTFVQVQDYEPHKVEYILKK